MSPSLVYILKKCKRAICFSTSPYLLRYWRLYDRRSLPVAADRHRQRGAPAFAVDRGAELFAFADAALAKPRGRPPVAPRAEDQFSSGLLSSSSQSSSGSGSSRATGGRRARGVVGRRFGSCSAADAAGQGLASGCVSNSVAQHVKHGYYAATSYADAQVLI
jgi:hypothetical protein